MALLENVSARPPRPVELTSGRVLQPGEQALADPALAREAALIAAGALAVVDPDAVVPPSAPHSELVFALVGDRSDGDILQWDEDANTWVSAPNTGGGGGGDVTTEDLQDAIDRIWATIADLYLDDFYADGVTPAAATAQQDLDAIRAAWAAAEALREAGKWAIVNLPNRQINPQGSGTADYVVTWTPSWSSPAGGITIKGHGQTGSVIRLGASQKCFMQWQYGSTSAPPTYRNLRLEDFTVDAASQVATTSAQYGVIINTAGRASMYNFAAERVDTINVGTLKISGIERRGMNFTLFGGGLSSAYCEIVGFRLKDCYFGRSGGGGNYGVVVQAFPSGTQTFQDIQAATAFGGRSNVWFDKFDIQGCTYDSGGPMPGGIDSYSSTGFMFGNTAMGGSLRIRDCHAKNAADDGFEVNSWYDVVVDGCTAVNCPQEGFYFTNLGGMPFPERQTIRVSNCSTYKTDVIGQSTTLYGIGVRGRADAPHGLVIVENCRAVGNPETLQGVQALVFRDYIRHIIVRDFHVGSYAQRTYTSNGSTSAFGAPVVIALFGVKATVDIDGVYVDQVSEYDFDGFGNEQFQNGAVSISSGADLTVRARNCNVHRRMRTDTGLIDGFGASVRRLTVVGFGARTIPNSVDSMGIATPFTGAGAIGETSANWAWSGDLDNTDGDAGGKFVTSGAMTELAFRTSVQEATDGVTWAQFKTPAAIAAGFKAMVSPKSIDTAITGANRHRTGPSRLIETYVCDDGTSSFLCVDKVTFDVAGTPTRTSLLGPVVGGAGNVSTIDTAAITTAGGDATHYASKGIQLSSRLAGAQTVYVYGAIRDNVVTAHLGSAAPSSTTYQPGTTIATTTVTLADADAHAYGDPVVGSPALGLVGVDNTSRFLNWTFGWRMVVRGVLEGLNQSAPRPGIVGGDASAAYVYADSNLLRFAGLHISDVDLSRMNSPSSSITPVGGADATQVKGIRIGPGVVLGDGQRVDRPAHPSMVTGSVAGGNSGTAQTVDVGGSDYWLQTHTLTGNCTFTLAGVPKGGTVELLLTQDATGSRVPSFTPPAGGSVKWAGGSAGMTATPGATDLLTLTTLDGVNFIGAGAHDIK